MALTTSDLKKIEALFDYKFEIRFKEKFAIEMAPFKADIAEIKELILEMHTFLMSEVQLHSHRLENHEARIVTLERAL